MAANTNRSLTKAVAQSGQRMRLSSKRTRFALNLGCVPVTLIVTLGFVLVLNLLIFWQAPSWVSNPEEYLFVGRTMLSLGTLMALQMLLTWGVGLIAAIMGIRAASGQGKYVRRRVDVIRRRIAVGAWAIIAIRLLALLVLCAATLYGYATFPVSTSASSPPSDLSIFVFHQPFLFGLAVAVGVLHLFLGPPLRLRYSLALGAMAGSWTKNRDHRPWLALTGRLGLGLAGLLMLIWGLVIMRLLYTIVFNPFAYAANAAYAGLFPRLPGGAAQIGMIVVMGVVVLAIHTAVQIASTPLVLALTRAQLRKPKRAGYHAKTGLIFREVAKRSRISQAEASQP